MSILDKVGLAWKAFNLKPKVMTMQNVSWKNGGALNLSTNNSSVSDPMSDSSIVYTCVTLIATNIALAKIKFYRGDDQLPANDPVVQLFRKPNSQSSAQIFFEESTTFFALHGECFWYKVKSLGNRELPAELYNLNPKLMEANINDKGFLESWTYNKKQDFTLDEILHIKKRNPSNSVRGLSPLPSIKYDMDADYLAAQFSKSHFVNEARPGFIFTRPTEDESTDEQMKEFLKQYNAAHSGPAGNNKGMVGGPGMDVKTLGLSQQDMMFVECRRYAANNIAAAFFVPPPKINDLTNANYSNAESFNKSFWNSAMFSYLRRYEDSINNFLLNDYDPTITAKFDITEVREMQKDMKEQADVISIYANLGVPFNMLAEAYNLPIGNIDKLDVGYMNMSMVEVGSDPFADEPITNNSGNIDISKMSVDKGKEITAKVQEKSVRSRFLADRAKGEKQFTKTLKKYWFEQRTQILKLLGADKSTTSAEVTAFMDKFDIWEAQNKKIVPMFGPVYTELAEAAGESALVNIGQNGSKFNIDKTLIRKRMRYLISINNTTKDTIKRIVTIGIEEGKNVASIAKDIKRFYAHISKTRAKVIARTETGSLINGQQIKTYKDKGVTKKRWVGGNRDAHAAVSGTTVKMNESFDVDGESLMYPGDVNGSAKNTINCTCSISPIVD